MDDDHLFRLILIAGFVLLIPVGVYHRLRSQATGEQLDRREEGWFILVTLRPLGVAHMAGLIAFMIDPTWMAWSALPVPAWLRWAGVGIGVLAGLLLSWTVYNLGKNLTDTVVTRKEHMLVTSGPYRWVRHPFYLAFALAGIANSLTTANGFLALTGGLAFMLILIRTRTEEQKLLERFGDKYRQYRERTGCLFPKIL